MEKLIDISSYPVAQVLDVLLQDKTTKKNIIWATDTYAEFGEAFTDKVQLDANAILRRTDLIRPRIQKSQEAQAQRTRKKAEVFTPAWLCNQMNNHCDEDWFGAACLTRRMPTIPGRYQRGRSNSRKKRSGSTMWTPAGWRSPVARLRTWFPGMMYRREN